MNCKKWRRKYRFVTTAKSRSLLRLLLYHRAILSATAMWAQPVQYAPAEEMSLLVHPAEIHAEGNVTRCGRLYMNSAAGIIRTCFSYNGIQRKMPRIRPKRFLTAASGKCGGTAKKATPGRPLFTSGPAGRAAPTAQAGKWGMATTLHRCIRRWPPNGTCGKTHRGSRPTFWRGATALRGGSVKRGTPGRHRSIPGCPAAAVPSVRDGSMDPAKSVMTGS